MSVESRRNFLATSGKLLVSTLALGSIAAQATEEHAQMHGGSGDGLAVAATSKNICGTCQFWGGMRKISDDKKEVIAQSMGWCNNPDSPNHQKLTAADHQMKKPGIWKMWPAL
jgi:anaerobic selenocysteine-containing dehydrogenase